MCVYVILADFSIELRLLKDIYLIGYTLTVHSKAKSLQPVIIRSEYLRIRPNFGSFGNFKDIFSSWNIYYSSTTSDLPLPALLKHCPNAGVGIFFNHFLSFRHHFTFKGTAFLTKSLQQADQNSTEIPDQIS